MFHIPQEKIRESKCFRKTQGNPTSSINITQTSHTKGQWMKRWSKHSTSFRHKERALRRTISHRCKISKVGNWLLTHNEEKKETFDGIGYFQIFFQFISGMTLVHFCSQQDLTENFPSFICSHLISSTISERRWSGPINSINHLI